MGLFAQNITVNSKVDIKKIMIGDWMKLSLHSEHSSDIKLFWPILEESIGKFEVVSRDSFPKVIEENGRIVEDLNAVISAYDSGTVRLPAIKFEFNTSTDTTRKEIFTEPIDINVQIVAVDTTQDIKDIKPPLDIPFPIWLILIYIAIIIFIVALGYAIWHRIKTKKRLPLFEKAEPKLSAYELAYKELYQLEEKKLWQKGMVKEYYTEVTEIIRKYLERRYGIDALEMTSGEILNTIITVQPDTKIQEVLKGFLNLADYVKFARFQPVSNENEMEIKRAYSFVEETKEKPELNKETKPELTEQQVENKK
jgi:hypothetical protein